MSIVAQSADGTSHEFPDGTNPAVIDKVMKDYAQQGSSSKVGPLADSLHTLPGALAKGVNSVLGIPGDVTHLLDTGMDKLTGAHVADTPKPGPSLPTSDQLNTAVSKPFGGMYQPQTTAGKYTDTIAQFAPAALAPGSMAMRLGRVIAPGVASETAGEATAGTPLEGPARLGGALLGASGVGGVKQLLSQGPKEVVPSVADLKGAAHQSYNAAEQAGVIIPGAKMQELAQTVQSDLADAGVDKTLHPRATAAIGRLADTASDTTIKGLDILRRVAGSAARTGDADEARLANRVLDHIDDFVENLSPADVSAGDPQAASAALSDARSLWAKGAKGDTIETLMDRAKNRAETIGGSGYENALRVEFRGLAQNAKRMARFSDDEQEAIRDVARGGPISNTLRTIGKLAPTNVVSALGEMGGMMADPKMVAVPIAGTAARLAATAMTTRRANLASELVRRGSAATPTKQVWSPELITALLGQKSDQQQVPAAAYGRLLQGSN